MSCTDTPRLSLIHIWTFDIPAIDAMVHHYLHPLRDFIMACLVTSSCCIIYLVRRQQLVLIENEQLQAENIRNQYEVLKNQLNPHMLFNSLNTPVSYTHLKSYTSQIVKEDQIKQVSEFNVANTFDLDPTYETCMLTKDSQETMLFNKFIDTILWHGTAPTSDTLRTDLSLIHICTGSGGSSSDLPWNDNVAKKHTSVKRR